MSAKLSPTFLKTISALKTKLEDLALPEQLPVDVRDAVTQANSRAREALAKLSDAMGKALQALPKKQSKAKAPDAIEVQRLKEEFARLQRAARSGESLPVIKDQLRSYCAGASTPSTVEAVRIFSGLASSAKTAAAARRIVETILSDAYRDGVTARGKR